MSGESELRRTSDAFLARVERLHELEEAKRELTPGTPEMLHLAHEIEEMSADILGWARRETELAELAAKNQPGKLRPISIVPPRAIHEILRDWREAERVLANATAGTAPWEAARADVEQLRDEYRRAIQGRSG